jgi:hypothetical protein
MTIEFSAEIGKISKALVGAQADVGIAVKNQENSHFKSAYADLPAVLEVATPALAKHGLALIQAPGSGTDSLTLTTLLLHESGEWMLLPLAAIPLQAATAHGFGSALSYLRRYATQACLKISVGLSDDDDANIATSQAPQAIARTQNSEVLFDAIEELKKTVRPNASLQMEDELSRLGGKIRFFAVPALLSAIREVATIGAEILEPIRDFESRCRGESAGESPWTPSEAKELRCLYELVATTTIINKKFAVSSASCEFCGSDLDADTNLCPTCAPHGAPDSHESFCDY